LAFGSAVAFSCGPFGLGALNLIHHAIMWRAIINASLFGGASAWYFYFKPNVAAHFRQLKNRI
jgi:hypothetical protein